MLKEAGAAARRLNAVLMAVHNQIIESFCGGRINIGPLRGLLTGARYEQMKGIGATDDDSADEVDSLESPEFGPLPGETAVVRSVVSGHPIP